MSICSIGILSDCNCDDTRFDSTNIVGSRFQDVDLCEVNHLMVDLYDDPVVIPISYNYRTLYDSVSLVCGNADGTSWCGGRELVLYDVDAD